MRVRLFLPPVLSLIFTVAAAAEPRHPVSLDNDDSCDISVAPAATLLLPFFEVDLQAPAGQGETTVFTVINTGGVPQVAHVVRAERRFSVDFDAAYLGNGCTPPLLQSNANDPSGAPIGPAANTNP